MTGGEPHAPGGFASEALETLTAYRNWVAATRELVSSEGAARAMREARFAFASALGHALAGGLDATHVVYGIYLNCSTRPLYIGQSADPARRLSDLPIGESHHVGHSFPPETWERVVVVDWPRAAAGVLPEVEEAVCLALGGDAGDKRSEARALIGKAVEYMLQCRFVPLFSSRKKRKDGSWRQVRWAASKSRAAQLSPLVKLVEGQVLPVWEALAAVHPAASGSVLSDLGRVVFPRCRFDVD